MQQNMNISDTSILVKALAATRSPVTITDCRLPDNPIVYCNAAFLDLTEYDKSEVIGKNCRFLQGNRSNQKAVATLRESIGQNKDVHVIIRNFTKSGKGFWNDLQVSPIYDDRGTITHFIGLQMDVTIKVEQERANAKAKRLKLRNEMLELEKQQLQQLNEAKDDFISVASHQLRTPATVVKQYLGMLEYGIYGELSANQLEALSVAYASNDRQLAIIDKLLQIARIDAGKINVKKNTMKVSAMLEDIAEEFKYRLIDNQQTMSYDFDDDDTTITGDKELLCTVFENIIDNAIKYSQPETNIKIIVSSNKSELTIKIQDQGIGMSQESLDKLFKKFTRIENPSTKDIGGTGLGLYWAKKALDLHGATISVESKPKHGSTFTMVFPIS